MPVLIRKQLISRIILVQRNEITTEYYTRWLTVSPGRHGAVLPQAQLQKPRIWLQLLLCTHVQILTRQTNLLFTASLWHSDFTGQYKKCYKTTAR